MKRIIKAAAACLAALALAGCEPPPEFTAALSDPGAAAQDWVAGAWYSPPQDGYMNPHAPVLASVAEIEPRPGETGPLYSFVVTFQDEAATSFGFTGYPSRIGDAVYWNLVRTRQPRPGDGAEPPFWVREEGAGSVSYTEPGAEPGHLIARFLQPAPDTVLVCILFFHDVTGAQEFAPRMAAALKGQGMSATSVETGLTLNGAPLVSGGQDETAVHTVVNGGRDALRALVARDPGQDFQAALLLERLGAPWRDPAKDPALAQGIAALGPACEVKRPGKG